MHLCHVTIYVNDLQKSLYFYKNILGFVEQRHLFIEPNLEIVFLDANSTKIELIHNKQQNTCIGSRISLGFEVDSIEKTQKLLGHNGITFGDIHHPSPHEKFFFTNDPDGVRIQFIEYMDN